ncbi:DnaJ domain containing protein [Hordeum vulgare]|nr:DnaJ domain containing protein [Hordeum vulgare]
MAAEAANREEAERALRRAEEHFLAGNVAGARRLAAKARRISPSLPGAAHALAAYDVHAAAAGTQHRAGYWHDVLGVARSASASAVKKQFRRLSLLVHPDKNRSAAAEGAFKLLAQACDALSSGSGAGAGYVPYYYTSPATTAASAQEWYRSHHAAKPSSSPPKPSTSGAPPPPAAESGSRSGAARFVHVRCEHCKVSREVPGGELAAGDARCVRCKTVLREQEQKRTYVWTSSGSYHQVPSENHPSPPPPPTKPATFQCPARCPQCETQFTSMVSAGTWNLRCRNCLKRVMVKVKGPEEATCR